MVPCTTREVHIQKLGKVDKLKPLETAEALARGHVRLFGTASLEGLRWAVMSGVMNGAGGRIADIHLEAEVRRDADGSRDKRPAVMKTQSGAPCPCRVRSRDSRTTPPVEEHLSKIFFPSLGSCFCPRPCEVFHLRCLFHIVVAACRIDFGFVHLARAQRPAVRSRPLGCTIPLAQRTLGSASKVSNFHITCEVHVEAGRQRELFQLKRADSMCVKLIHTSLASQRVAVWR